MALTTYKQEGAADGGYGQYSSDSQPTTSYFGKSMQITGEITSDEQLTIEGKVNGNINISKPLKIGKNGMVNGEINAEAVTIDGEVEGNIVTSGKLAISSGGKFSGSMKSDKLVIEEGAVFKGNVNLDE
jgi:cytoskeletal protein CcmA (bactofilin family)